MGAADDPERIILHDDAYRYAFRRSRSARLAAEAAIEAVEAVEGSEAEDAERAGGPATADAGGRTNDGAPLAHDGERTRILLVAAARAALERFLPPSLPPRVQAGSDLHAALSALAPGEREFLLLHHWDGLAVGTAARASGQDAGGLPDIEAACARRLAEPAIDLAAVLASADPARAVSEEDLGRSHDALSPGAPSDADLPVEAPSPSPSTPPAEEPLDLSVEGSGSRRRRIRTTVGAACLLLIVVALVSALIPRRAAGPAEDTARLYDLAEVVAIVAASNVRPTVIDDEVRMLRGARVVQFLKGGETGRVLTVDVTGRSTLERTYGRSFFPPNQLMFLVQGEHGILAPIEGEDSVLTLVNRRVPEAATVTGDPAPLPDGLRDAIHAMPAGEIPLGTSGAPPGALDPAAVVGVRPPEGRDPQDLPGTLLGTFRIHAEDGQACVLFSFNDRAILLRWPEGFTAHERRQPGSSIDGDPATGRRVLTVLNDRGYPYVDDNRSTPFIRGVPAGERGECGGQELEVWDIAVDPGSTLLVY
ncbi:hypothetical protein [Arthrobacter sp. B0490]|uniref:hypothetical protein n=1 Tax=Arthrobacter sp. B0490 TaxID=2058891 RepID=UPI000CE2D734|nr:hypothetical protein [Arthrobacter sp. B0490]